MNLQHEHAERIRAERAEREWREAQPQAAAYYDAMIKFAKEAKPAWFGKESPAEKNTYAVEANRPKVFDPASHHKQRRGRAPSRGGVEGGMISFTACVSDGAGGYVTKIVNANATMHDAP